tara:strand:- start:271 stop:633 length:363 start_codon:yes stop_codon:yes gene_type:complete
VVRSLLVEELKTRRLKRSYDLMTILLLRRVRGARRGVWRGPRWFQEVARELEMRARVLGMVEQVRWLRLRRKRRKSLKRKRRKSPPPLQKNQSKMRCRRAPGFQLVTGELIRVREKGRVK